MRTAVLLTALVALVSFGCARVGDMESELGSLVDAERAFAQASLDRGWRAAFLEYLGEGSIAFQPEPVDARAWYEKSTADSSVLSWGPVYADISRGGDMGYTTGPWTHTRATADGEVTYHGQYVSVWKRESGGAWRVAIDIGISHAEPAPDAGVGEAPVREVTHPELPAGWRGTAVDLKGERLALLDADRGFADAVASAGSVEAYRKHTACDVRLYRQGREPRAGQDAALAALARTPGSLVWEPAAAHVSRSGDLGYTYGASTFTPEGDAPAERRNYLKIWKKGGDGRWRVVLDIADQLPEPRPEPTE